MEIENLLKDLIKIESITPKDEGCFDLIEPLLEDLGFKCERMNYDNVENLYATLGNEGPLMCFLGHTDVVPTGPIENWSQPPFSAVTIDGHMYGRGTADMKGNIAAYLLALKDFLSTNPALNYRLAVLLTSNEEGEPEDGKIDVIIKKFMDDGEHIDFCLVGEPSSNKKVGDTIRIGRRGSLSGTLKSSNINVNTTGSFNGDMFGKDITIAGNVEGEINSDEHIIVNQSANIKGTIEYSALQVSYGAKIQGTLRHKGSVQSYTHQTNSDDQSSNDNNISEDSQGEI